jgi:hypothetical protein
MPYWRPPKIEDLAREMSKGEGFNPDAVSNPGHVLTGDIPIKNWERYRERASMLIALFAEELTGKQLPLPRRILSIGSRPNAMILEFRNREECRAMARCLQALRLREAVDAGEIPEGEDDDAQLDVPVSQADGGAGRKDGEVS